MRVWLIIIAAGLVTYAARASFILLGERATLPDSVQKALRFVTPAAFAAISASAALGGDGLSNFDADLPRLIALTLAGAAICRTRSMPISLAVGMLSLWSLQWLGL